MTKRLITQKEMLLTLLDKVANAYYLYYDRRLALATISTALGMSQDRCKLYAETGKELIATNDPTVLRKLIHGEQRQVGTERSSGRRKVKARSDAS